MSNRSEFPDSYQNRRRNQQEEVNIIWEESDDVYKPIPKNLSDFMGQKDINLQPEESVYGVYINADALSNLKTHLKTNLKVEQGGILFGNAYEDSELGKQSKTLKNIEVLRVTERIGCNESADP